MAVELPASYFQNYAWGPQAPEDKSYDANWENFGFQVFEHYLYSLEECGLQAPKTILDIGCANGNTLRELASRGFTVRGIENSQAAVDLAKDDVKSWIKQGDATEIVRGFKERAFDTVFDCVSQYLGDEQLDVYFRDLYRITNTDLVVMVSTQEYASGAHEHQVQFKPVQFWRDTITSAGFVEAGDPDENVFWFQRI